MAPLGPDQCVCPAVQTDSTGTDVSVFSSIIKAIQTGRPRPFAILFQTDRFYILVLKPDDHLALDIDVLDLPGLFLDDLRQFFNAFVGKTFGAEQAKNQLDIVPVPVTDLQANTRMRG